MSNKKAPTVKIDKQHVMAVNERQFILESQLRASNAEKSDLKKAVKYWQENAECREKELDVAMAIGKHLNSINITAGRKTKSPAVPIAVLGDWHCEETVEKASVNGLNEYNLDIADLRIKTTFQGILREIKLRKSVSEIDEMVMVLNGDIISGHIHLELLELNSISPTQAVLWAQTRIIAGIKMLLREGGFKKIRVPCQSGNHARTTVKTQVSTGYRHSYEWLMYHQLALVFQDEPRVEFLIPQSYLTWIKIFGRDIRIHHGDALKYGGGVGGMTIPVNKAIGDWNKSTKAWLDIFGHFHTALDGGHWVSNGSIIGYGPYALRIKAAFQPPIQQLIFVEKDHSKPIVIPIFCNG